MLDSEGVEIHTVDSAWVELVGRVKEDLLEPLRPFSQCTCCSHEPAVAYHTLPDVHGRDAFIAPERMLRKLVTDSVPLDIFLVLGNLVALTSIGPVQGILYRELVVGECSYLLIEVWHRFFHAILSVVACVLGLLVGSCLGKLCGELRLRLIKNIG